MSKEKAPAEEELTSEQEEFLAKQDRIYEAQLHIRDTFEELRHKEGYPRDNNYIDGAERDILRQLRKIADEHRGM